MTTPEAEMERLQARVHLQVRDEVFFLVLLIDGIYRKYDCSYGLTQALLYLQLVVFSMIFLYASYQEQQDSLDHWCQYLTVSLILTQRSSCHILHIHTPPACRKRFPQ